MKVCLRVPVQDTVDASTAAWLIWVGTQDVDLDIGLHQAAGWGVANARNDIVRDFLKGDWTHLWMVDSDLEPPRHLRFLEGGEQYEVLAGCYPVVTPAGFRWGVYKQIKPELWVPMHPRFVPKGKFFRADTAGTGCILIQRGVLERLGPDPFEFRRDASGDWLGEDMLFGQKSGGVWVDTEYVCEHHRRAPLIHCWKTAMQEYGGKR